MSINDRLGQIRGRIIRAREGRHTDRHLVLDVDAPAMAHALHAVLDLHQQATARVIVGAAGHDIAHCVGCTQGVELAPWPCATRRAIAAALGEDTP